MGRLNSEESKNIVRILCSGLIATVLFVAEAANAAKSTTCESLFVGKQAKDATEVAAVRSPASRRAKPEVKSNEVMSGLAVPTSVAKDDLAKRTRPEDVKLDLELLASVSQYDKSDTISEILGERRSLMEFLVADTKRNIAVNSPFTIMNAAQRMLALIYSQGKEQVRLQLTGEPIEVYPFFSSGRSITNGFRVVGNEKAIAEFVDNLKAQAKGDRSGASVILLVGSHGTGKSETLKLLGTGAEKLTSQTDAKYASYTFEWTNLGDIPELHRFIPSTTTNGITTYSNIEAPLGDSPFVLLPSEIQSEVVKAARASATALIDGMTPSPFAEPDPISRFIRNEIIQHYAKVNGRQPNALEIVRLLDKHTIVKRQILGQNYGKMPLIDVQGNDIDVAGLFMAPNPVVRFAAGAGPAHPMAWYLNGKFLQGGHGTAVLVDEILRNNAEFQNLILSSFESRRISVGGAPTVQFDSVLIAASNTASLSDVKSDDRGAAFVDRFKITPMRWSVFPGEIAQLLLAMKGSELHQQSLADEDAPIVKGNIDELLPRTQGASKTQIPDYRYRLFFGEGPQKVQIAPHTLMMMAEIIAATRMEMDPAKAEKEVQGKYLTSHLFRNPIDRLRLYEGAKPEVQPDEIRELTDAAILLKQGENGISARDAGRWLTEAITAASKDRAEYTLTPGIVLKTFRSMLKTGSITYPSTKVRLQWEELAREVVSQLLIPRLNHDISRALANGDRVVNDAYFDVLEEIFALHTNPEAMTYMSPKTGQETPIDRVRMQAVREIYQQRNGRALSISQISLFHARQNTTSDIGKVPDDALLDAVAAYHAALNTQIVGFPALVEYERTGTGSDDVKWAHQSLVSALQKMGYNKMAMRDALLLTHKVKSQNEVPQQ